MFTQILEFVSFLFATTRRTCLYTRGAFLLLPFLCPHTHTHTRALLHYERRTLTLLIRAFFHLFFFFLFAASFFSGRFRPPQNFLWTIPQIADTRNMHNYTMIKLSSENVCFNLFQSKIFVFFFFRSRPTTRTRSNDSTLRTRLFARAAGFLFVASPQQPRRRLDDDCGERRNVSTHIQASERESESAR